MKVLHGVQLAGLALRNRIAVAPMSRMQANEDGTATADMAEYYGRYAAHRAGLIFTEAIYVDSIASRAYFNQPGLANEEHCESWRPVTRAVHSAGGTIFAQLQHGGRLSEPDLNPHHLAASDGAATGSTWQTGRPNGIARAATMAEINDIVHAFGRAARYATQAGFDGVEIHGARGYLIDDFLSFTSNHRQDDFGGALEKRLAFPLAVVRHVRKLIGTTPLSFNLSLYKMDDGHYQPPRGPVDETEIVRSLQRAGVDIFHVSTRKALRPEPWGRSLAGTVRDALVTGDVIVNGGIATLEECELSLKDSGASMVSIARPFLANPDWIDKMISGTPVASYTPGQERLPLI